MKKYMKVIIAMLILALCVGGLAIRRKQIAHEELESQILVFEIDFYNIVLNAEEAVNDMDTVALKDCRDRLAALQEDIQLKQDEARNETVIALYSELNTMVSYYSEMLSVVSDVVNNPWNLLTGMPDEVIDNILQKLEEHGDKYNEYKQELELETSNYLEDL
jgi:hypothetical protein